MLEAQGRPLPGIKPAVSSSSRLGESGHMSTLSCSRRWRIVPFVGWDNDKLGPLRKKALAREPTAPTDRQNGQCESHGGSNPVPGAPLPWLAASPSATASAAGPWVGWAPTYRAAQRPGSAPRSCD